MSGVELISKGFLMKLSFLLEIGNKYYINMFLFSNCRIKLKHLE